MDWVIKILNTYHFIEFWSWVSNPFIDGYDGIWELVFYATTILEVLLVWIIGLLLLLFGVEFIGGKL